MRAGASSGLARPDLRSVHEQGDRSARRREQVWDKLTLRTEGFRVRTPSAVSSAISTTTHVDHPLQLLGQRGREPTRTSGHCAKPRELRYDRPSRCHAQRTSGVALLHAFAHRRTLHLLQLGRSEGSHHLARRSWVLLTSRRARISIGRACWKSRLQHTAAHSTERFRL